MPARSTVTSPGKLNGPIELCRQHGRRFHIRIPDDANGRLEAVVDELHSEIVNGARYLVLHKCGRPVGGIRRILDAEVGRRSQ